jgi:hypothetical protein
MLTALLVFSFVLPAPECKNPAGSFMTSPRPNGVAQCDTSFNLKPQWQAVASTDGHARSTLAGDETNLEQWRNHLELKTDVDEMVPHTAIEKHNPNSSLTVASSVGSAADLPNSHCPWHLAMQRYWPAFFRNNVLVYELTKVPTSPRPYYEAIVCSMPNIRCRAKTIEALQEQLLKQYASYLETLLEDTVPEGNSSDKLFNSESWIARLSLKSQLSNEPRSRRPTRAPGLTVEVQKVPAIFDPGYFDLIFPYGIHDYSY